MVLSQSLNGKFTHWVKNEFVDSVLSSGAVVPSRSTILNKPNGVWISWNNGWEDWCKSDMPDWIGDGRVCLDVKIKDGLNLWLIDSLDDFMVVWNKFTEHSPVHGLLLVRFWVWLREQGFDGVALTDNGHWATRRDTFLYGWDCESIVIFDPKNVTFSRGK